MTRRPTFRLVQATRVVILLGAVTLGLGLVLPCMTVQTTFGEYESWLRLLSPETGRARRYSVLSGIMAMMNHDSPGIGLLLLFFSAIFPTAKLAIMAWATQALATGGRAGGLLTFAHHTGKFSMLDVLVLALIVVSIKGLGDTVRVSLGPGVALFAISVVTSLVASVLLHRLEMVAADRGNAPGPQVAAAGPKPAPHLNSHASQI